MRRGRSAIMRFSVVSPVETGYKDTRGRVPNRGPPLRCDHSCEAEVPSHPVSSVVVPKYHCGTELRIPIISAWADPQ